MRDWLVILMLVMAAWEGGATATTPNLPKRIQCLQNTVDVPARHLMSNGEIIKFRMEMSQRVTHQLVTHIFAIYVQEVLGYQGVELLVSRDNFNTTHYLSRLTESTNSIDSVPDVIANLELWLPPETSLYSQKVHDHFREAGNSGPPGRFGWFFPRRHLGATPTMDHYSVLQSPNSSAIFAVGAGELEALRRRYAVNATSGKYFCDADVCKDGVFTPKRCVNRQHQCALLLTSHYDATSFVVEHINHLGLFVQVLWVGDNLESAVQDMHTALETEEAALHARQRRSDKAALEESRWLSDEALLHGPHRRSFVFLHWTPSRLVVPEDDRYVSVAFPPCESLSSTAADGCKYDLNRLVKIIWSRLDKAGPYIHNALINMEFKASDYRDLLQRYERGLALGRGIYDVACDWMRDNLAVYERWTAETVDVSELYIGGIFPVLIPEYNGQGILWASKMAVDAVNANSSVLSGYKLTLLPKDGKCRSDAVIKSFVEFIKADRFPKLAGILGPACSDSVEPLAGVATIYKTVVMSYSAEGSNFSDRVKYPYFFRTIGENYQYTFVYMQLMKKMKWQQVAAITQDGTKYGQYISKLQDKFTENKMRFLSNRKYPVDRERGSMRKYLLEIKKAKIIIADIYNDAARDAMCEAYKLGMTAREGYVWFLPMWMNPHWYNTTYYNQVNNENVSCTTDQMIKAINGHLGLTFAHFGRDSDVTLENRTVSEWKKEYRDILAKNRDEESIYSGYAYDAVWTYALALDKLLNLNSSYLSNLHNEDTVKLLVQFIADTDFMGVSGRVQFKGRSTRLSDIHVVQWLNNKTHIVGTFHPNDSDPDGGVLKLDESSIVWLTADRKRPEDGTEQCFIQWFANMLDTSCDRALIVMNLFALFMLGLFVLVILMVLKGRYDENMEFGLEMKKRFGNDMTGLDDWEVSHQYVVINRVLGEGAFGTVYGGEAAIEEDKDKWVPVAVKALKPGSSTEDKLDFFSEAETMKRFDHKNIVKLLGVCMKEAPLYTIMEFMLYGDLKTYLLARRHMVNDSEAVEASEEISSRRLTSMALDIARALSYLAQIKYVHRDVASRNCLVGSKIVKLGDFGMTRPVFDCDHYKFRRKGMLPVRWMAPESLALGVFSAASDCWSYGVLLYEITTFGSFPFQGMTNNEVLDHVKSGKTLQIPKKVKPHLEGLISSCWHIDPKRRPPASEIVVFLANHPKLITPCLDVPLSSVQIEHSDTFPPPPGGGGGGVGGVGGQSALRNRVGASRNRSVTSLMSNGSAAPPPLAPRRSLTWIESMMMKHPASPQEPQPTVDGYVDVTQPQPQPQTRVWPNPIEWQQEEEQQPSHVDNQQLVWDDSLTREPLLPPTSNGGARVVAGGGGGGGGKEECRYVAMMRVTPVNGDSHLAYVPKQLIGPGLVLDDQL
ncbi:uncharacterized protein LOC111045716 isoform X1 [Nilaparvata lugens]|uniref:uncharacterized protein LOC111045716 isoform X1 n=2 Tax=Nilaparvata lugens TaxID=108931 RepID=UPI00193E6D21|nr:uncharacterized protein LOC111045716 isoform X1 [Nilaparvata lugens]XP_039299978.1 uncharacterized protein LOC111045716 isoform X1 [Nilaparvata lugens]XP_039299979.1 uncharacterized protein LOC111045716 isoform X1 [Nilaparvata lugens]XP_039299980.1 uncharacterized protein LOC111045716 isoform X1 [Nilaparvata lugens]XP_039299981.1 uncharacterized protein LOC111045716 isoform X1 [Nilaparvata lugens]XP_039299982.1 uncharacterized protein LOC111045716 isoform X1 [Nilaparvata lugens]